MQPIPRIATLDCTTRMFVSCICMSLRDINALGLECVDDSGGISAECQSRSVMHRLLSQDFELAIRATDALDLKFADQVSHVRSLDARNVLGQAHRIGTRLFGEELAGWAWALISDERDQLQTAARRLMGECYVRGIRSLVEAPGDRATRPGRADSV